MRTWVDNWQDPSHVVTGMNRQGYPLHLANVDHAVWRAMLSNAPMLSADGFGAGATPWRAISQPRGGRE